MYKIEESTLKDSLKPFDVVKLRNGDIAYINEVSVNTSQESPKFQIGYSIRILSGTTNKLSWYDKNELEYQCNLFIEIAKNATHNMGQSSRWVKKLFESF